MQMMSATASDDTPVQGHDHHHHNAPNVCVWCQNSLHMRRSHCLPEGSERNLIAERILPRHVSITFFHIEIVLCESKSISFFYRERQQLQNARVLTHSF